MLDDKCHTTKVDVFSFGMIIWELAHGERAWAGLHGLAKGARIHALINAGQPPSSTASAKDGGAEPTERRLQELVARCWSQKPEERPEERPEFAEIVKELEGFLDRESKD